MEFSNEWKEQVNRSLKDLNKEQIRMDKDLAVAQNDINEIKGTLTTIKDNTSQTYRAVIVAGIGSFITLLGAALTIVAMVGSGGN